MRHGFDVEFDIEFKYVIKFGIGLIFFKLFEFKNIL